MTSPAAPTGGARRVLLARHRAQAAAQTEALVHLMPLPLAPGGGTTSALCGTQLNPADLQTVPPGEGVWCTMCFTTHITGGPAAPATPRGTGTDTVAGLRSAQAAYRALGWPITRHHHEIRLDLDDAVALAIPATLATTVAEILMERRCPPPVLAHPALPAHRIILAGDRYCIALPWPTGIHRVTDTLLLPPTVTAHGPVRWVRPPQRHALRLCREIDVLAALRTATHEDPPPPAPAHY